MLRGKTSAERLSTSFLRLLSEPPGGGKWSKKVGKWIQWLFLVPLKSGRWHIIPQLAVYTTYIPLIYCLLVGYMLPLMNRGGRVSTIWKQNMLLTNKEIFTNFSGTGGKEGAKKYKLFAVSAPNFWWWMVAVSYCSIHKQGFPWKTLDYSLSQLAWDGVTSRQVDVTMSPSSSQQWHRTETNRCARV